MIAIWIAFGAIGGLFTLQSEKALISGHKVKTDSLTAYLIDCTCPYMASVSWNIIGIMLNV
jgi:hypothetical protein